MIDEALERYINIYAYKIRPPIKGVSSVFLVVWNDRAMQDDKRKAWHATSTPSEKHGFREG